MRLTLRTLLAYLDKTLPEKDAEAIGEKIKESSFASQVVHRVQAVLTNGRLAAPSPGANGPTDDPNVVGEYLDSTLSAEQAAEVDRTCLESDIHLAEAAACHQVLTMVLGTPAEVPPELRKRIYELGRHADEQAEGVAGPSDATVVRPAIAPVGLDDSGAYRAATRLKAGDGESSEKETKGRGKGNREAAMAGSRPLSASEASEIFGDRIRTTRVVPWLVTLGVAALFLFVLAQAFDPLFNPEPVAIETDRDEATDPTIVLPTDENETESEVDTAPTTDEPDDVEAEQTGDGGQPAPQPPAEMDDATEDSDAPAEREVEGASESDARVAMADNDRDTEPTGDETPAPTPDSAEVDEGVDGIAQLASSQGLLIVSSEQQGEWERVGEEATVPDERTLVCPPLFRIRLTIEERADLVLVGPARMRVTGTTDQPQIVLERGRLMVASLADDVSVDLQLDDLSGRLDLIQLGNVAAIEVAPFRVPGTDPTNPENSIPVIKITSVVGRIDWSAADNKLLAIETSEQWKRIGSGDGQVAVPAEPVAWVDAPEGNRQTLDQAAREALLAFIEDGKPIELSLREAVGFRRAEVAALAAQTLLLMGKPDVYFGSEGILNTPSQKSYWTDHVFALQARLNEGPEAAAAIRQAAVEMEGASAETLFRLLWGYSPEQLKAGADATLIETLDSPQMSLRVLAIENLRQITGTSLFFKPEEEASSRRRNDIKKWETRLRRGDIRWESIPIPR